MISWILHQKLKKQRYKQIDRLKILNVCALEDTIKRLKKQPLKWEKIFVNHAYGKG